MWNKEIGLKWKDRRKSSEKELSEMEEDYLSETEL